jgi:hypothetical protein
MIKTSANVRVSIVTGGFATINVVANIPRSEATFGATIKITSGSATAHVSASAPNRGLAKQGPGKQGPSKQGPMLLLPPWDSAKL